MTVAFATQPISERPQPILTKRRRRQRSERSIPDHDTDNGVDGSQDIGEEFDVRHVHFELSKNQIFVLPKPISNREWKRREQRRQKELNDAQTAAASTPAVVKNDAPDLKASISTAIKASILAMSPPTSALSMSLTNGPASILTSDTVITDEKNKLTNKTKETNVENKDLSLLQCVDPLKLVKSKNMVDEKPHESIKPKNIDGIHVQKVENTSKMVDEESNSTNSTKKKKKKRSRGKRRRRNSSETTTDDEKQS